MGYQTRSQRGSDAELPDLPNLDAPKRIGLLLISGFALPEAVAVLEMFQSANTLSSPERADCSTRHEVALLSITGGRVESSSSVFVWTERVENWHLVDGFHMLFVAGGAGARHALRDGRLIRWLRREGQRCEAVVSIGDGRLLLDAAGIERSSHGWDVFLGSEGEPYRVAEGAFAQVATTPVQCTGLSRSLGKTSAASWRAKRGGGARRVRSSSRRLLGRFPTTCPES
jgi:putative intracellular protease/amidase